jgi:hypothetical protein
MDPTGAGLQTEAFQTQPGTPLHAMVLVRATSHCRYVCTYLRVQRYTQRTPAPGHSESEPARSAVREQIERGTGLQSWCTRIR